MLDNCCIVNARHLSNRYGDQSPEIDWQPSNAEIPNTEIRQTDQGVTYKISAVSGKSLPGLGANVGMRGPAQAAVTILLFRFKAAEFHRLQGENVSLTGLFSANPTAEMHGA